MSVPDRRIKEKSLKNKGKESSLIGNITSRREIFSPGMKIFPLNFGEERLKVTIVAQ
jgi:hypothetical protein